MMRSVKNVLLFLTIILALLLSNSTALADIAPPQQPPGSSLIPGQEGTRVRMLSETVLIKVLGTTPEGSLGRARVTASFEMQNLGDNTESMAVRFPISVNDGFYNYPEVIDFQVIVNGKVVPVRKQIIPTDRDDPLTWAEFDVTFPPGVTVPIEVSYQLNGTGEYPFISFVYLLETGAGWADTIGDVELILRLPYEANPLNVIFDEQIGWSQTTPGGEIVGNELRWYYQDLEPAWEHNLQVSLVMPSAWQTVLRERANVTDDPNDGEAWGRLGKVYKEIIYLRKWLRADQGGLELYELSKEAYQNAVDLLPQDAWWHAGYAQLLWLGTIDPYNPRGLDELLLTLHELDRTLQLDPDNELALEILDWLPYEFPEAVVEGDGGYDFLWLTATPEWTATQSPTSEPSPTWTPTPTSVTSPTPTPTLTIPPAQAPQVVTEAVVGALVTEPVNEAETTPNDTDEGSAFNLPFCGAVLFAPLLPLGLVLFRKRR